MEKSKNIALAAAMLCCAGPSLAQDAYPLINPSWYIQPHASALRPDRDFGVNERGYGGGLKIGKPISPM